MVKIPEYTRRDTYNAVSRPSTNLQLPDNLASSSKRNILGLSVNDLKTIASGAKEVSQEMVDMKNDYDNAKANEFISEYMKKADAQMQDYQQNRRGSLSKGVIEDFESWSENQFNDASGSTEYDKPAFFENEQQRNIARSKMDNINFNYYRGLSAFQAKEQEQYRENSSTAFIDSQARQVVNLSDPLSIANSFKDMDTEAMNNLYRGQSPEYVSLQLRPLKSNALAQNVINTAITNPADAVNRMTQPLFKDNMTDNDYEETKQTVIKSVKSFYSDNVAETAQYGVVHDQQINDVLSSPFFDGMNRDALRKEIIDEGSKKAKAIREKNHELSVSLQNKILSNAYGRDLTDEERQLVLSTDGGASTLDAIQTVRINEANEIWNMEQGEAPIEPTFDDTLNYTAISRRIKDGYYNTIGEMSNDINGIPPFMQKELIGSFMDELNYKEKATQLKNQGIDIEKELANQFTLKTGLNKEKDESAFKNFRNAVTNSVIDAQKMGQKIDRDLISNIASTYVSAMDTQNDDMSKLRKAESELYKTVQAKDRNLTKMKEEIHKIFNQLDVGDFLLEKQQEKIEDLIIDGAIEEAYAMLNYYRETSLTSDTYRRQRAAELLEGFSIQNRAKLLLGKY